MEYVIDNRTLISATGDSVLKNGSFLSLKSGKLMFAYIADSFGTSKIMAMTTDDGGTAWCEPRELYCSAKKLDGLSLLRMQNDDIGLFFTEEDVPDWSYFTVMLRSNDEGESIYFRTTDCSFDLYNGHFSLQNDSVITTESKKIIIPLTYRTGAYKDSGCAHTDVRAFGIFSCSEDDGATWASPPDDLYPTFSSSAKGLRHAQLVEILPDVIKVSFATDMMCQYQSFSSDGGYFWTPAEPSLFSSACSPMKTVKNYNGEFFAIWNPVPNYLGRESTEDTLGLTPLSISKLSGDSLRPEPPAVIAESDKVPVHSPAAIFTSENEMLISYNVGYSVEVIKIKIKK